MPKNYETLEELQERLTEEGHRLARMGQGQVRPADLWGDVIEAIDRLAAVRRRLEVLSREDRRTPGGFRADL